MTRSVRPKSSLRRHEADGDGLFVDRECSCPVAFPPGQARRKTKNMGKDKVLPPRAPTDPDVRTLAHPVLPMMDSPYSETLQARTAMLGRYGDT